MTDIRTLLQTTLDGVLAVDKIYSYWGEKSDTTGENPNYYVTYDIALDTDKDYAESKPFSRAATCVVDFYYRKAVKGTSAGRVAIKAYEEKTKTALRGQRFFVYSMDDSGASDSEFGRIIIEGTRGEGV